MKLCECGCGDPAPIAKRADKRRKAVKGKPSRFISGHNLSSGLDHHNWKGGRCVTKYGYQQIKGVKVDYEFLSKEEQKEIKRTIRTGVYANRVLKDFTDQVSSHADQNLILLKCLDQDKIDRGMKND